MGVLKRYDRVKDKTTTTGTGTITLDGNADTGYRTFTGVVQDGDRVRYLIVAGAEWEYGEGIYDEDTSDTLTRVTVFSSSNSGSLVNFSAGTKEVAIVAGGQDLKELPDFLVNQVFN